MPEHMALAANMYQKLEAMCTEVEDIKWKEGLQYVEKGLQTVGNSVKKFYSDIVIDALVASLDTFENATCYSSSVLNTDRAYEMPKECPDNDNTGKELCNTSHLLHSCPLEPFKATQHDSCLKEGADAGIFERSNLSIEEKHSKDKALPLQKPDDISIDTENESISVLPSTTNDTLESNFFTEMILEDAPSLNSIDSVAAFYWNALDPELSSGGVLIEIEPISVFHHSGLHTDLDSPLFLPGDLGLLWSLISIVDYIPIVITVGKSDFAATLLSSPMVKLEESCVIVDKSELCFLPHAAGGQKSPKKQLEKVFDSEWMAAMQNHHQKVALHVNPDIACSQQQQGEGLASSSITTPYEEFSEAEWEII